MKVTLDVETKTLIRIFVAVAAFVAIAFLVTKLYVALMLFAIAFFLSLALNPPVSFLASKLPGNSRILATAISYLFVLSVLGFLVYVALPPAVDQIATFINSLPSYARDVSDGSGFAADIINRFNLHDQVSQIANSLHEQGSALVQGIGVSLFNSVVSVFQGFITMLTLLILTFFMLVEGPTWLETLWSLYKNDRLLARHKRLASKMYQVITGFVNGQALVAALAAAAGFTVLVFLTLFAKIPISIVLPLTAVIFMADLVPMVGPVVWALICSLVLVLSNPIAALIFLVYFVVYSQIEANLIQPLVQSRSVALSALSIIVALVTGITLLGIVGGILAIPVAGCIRVLVLDYAEHGGHSSKPKSRLAVFKG